MLWRLADGIPGTVFPYVFPLGWNRLEMRYYSRKKSVYPWGTGIIAVRVGICGAKSLIHVTYGGTYMGSLVPLGGTHFILELRYFRGLGSHISLMFTNRVRRKRETNVHLIFASVVEQYL
jgi:hypothetical protein